MHNLETNRPEPKAIPVEKPRLSAFFHLLLVGGILLGVLVFPEVGSAEPEVLARVNGEPVTRTEFQRMLADPVAQVRLQHELGASHPESGALERLALRDLIHRRLLLQEAVRRNIKVADGELDQAISALRRRFPDLDSFSAWMHERGLDDKSLFEAIRTDMVAARVKAVLVEGLAVTEAEIRTYFEEHGENLVIGEEVRLRIIAVRNQAEADEILAAMQKGTSFAALARQRSLGKRAAQGGDMGWVQMEALAPALQQAVNVLRIGDVAGPLQKAVDEFLLVGLEGRRPLRTSALDEARPEIERRLLPAKQEAAIKAWLAQREKNSKIEIFNQFN
jgi:parvulin-like peptidyl-prolyl isomerase